MGEVIKLMDGEYSFELPNLPDEKEIWYYDTPKEYQYWKTPYAKNFKWLTNKGELRNVKQMTEKDRQEYINYWRDKWVNGLWFMRNGEPTYLTGMNLDHLVFNKFKSSNFYYLDSQRERFYFRELTNNDPLCDGRCWIKGRRVGITAEQITENIRCLIMDFSNHVAMQSDTHDKAKMSLLSPLIDVYIKRVNWMRENFYSSNGKVPRASLELIDITLRSDENYPLGGTARSFPSTPKALDGLEFMRITMDELSKWEDVSPYETFEINKKTIINPGKRGKQDILSTTGDSREAQKATKDWHKLISDSNPKVLNENGQTNTGLWRYFVSYINSFELIEKMQSQGLEIKDIYGNINRDMAEEYIWNDVKKYPKDSKEYVYALYKQPMEMRHALLTPTGQGYFSKLRITNRLDELREMPNDHKPYILGALEEYDNGKVYFESNIEREKRCEREGIAYVAGRWKIALHPYFSMEKNIDTRNRYRKSYEGVYFPPLNPEGCIGYDPIRYKKADTSSTSLSDASIIVYKKFDYFGSGDFNQYCALWLGRTDDPTDTNKEAMKACKYWGYPIMHERVIETVKTDFDEANMLPFLMKDPKNGLCGLWIDSQGKIVKNAISMMQSKFNAPLKTPDDADFYATHPFEESLQDMDLFDIGNTTAFNVFMSMVELEHGLAQLSYTNVTDQSVDVMSDIIHQIIPIRNR